MQCLMKVFNITWIDQGLRYLVDAEIKEKKSRDCKIRKTKYEV